MYITDPIQAANQIIKLLMRLDRRLAMLTDTVVPEQEKPVDWKNVKCEALKDMVVERLRAADERRKKAEKKG